MFRNSIFFLCNLFLIVSLGQNDEITVIGKNSQWSYYIGGILDTNTWYLNKITNDKWELANAPFGYHADSITTHINYGNDKKNKTLVYYFQKVFTIQDPDKYMGYILKLRRDDGAIIYINEKEVWRSNMPIQNSNNSLKALLTVNGKNEFKYYEKLLASNNFNTGINTISVSIHQRSKNSSDCAFDLELVATNDIKKIRNKIKHKSDTYDLIFRDNINTLKLQFELEKRATQSIFILKENSLLRTFIGVFFICFMLLFSGLIAWIYFILKNNKKMQMEIEVLNNIKHEKSKELLSDSLRFIENKSFLTSIKTYLTKISEKSNVMHLDKQELKNIIKSIQFNINDESEWKELGIHIDILHSEFANKLKIKFQNLTQNELRHCNLIRLHLSTKEIAKILHIDPRSVQSSRYRIKKKIGLNEEDDLRSFLMNF